MFKMGSLRTLGASTLVGLAWVSGCIPVIAASRSPLLAGFESPPESARPRLWWHWMNGNVTQAGIRADLKWMHSIGIGGVNVIDASLFTPSLVKHPLIYMSPGWRAAFRLAAHLATRYGMGLSIDSSPGWSETGGPWVRPGEAMKKLVWSTTVLKGGVPFHGKLPQPPSVTGPFQDAPLSTGTGGVPRFAHLRFYRDSLVIAYKAPILDPRPQEAVSSAGALGARSLSELSDGRLTDGLTLKPHDGTAWVQLRYAKPTFLQGVTLAATASGVSGLAVTVYASRDGTSWKAVARFPPVGSLFAQPFPQRTLSFAPITARYVRVVMRTATPPPPLSGPFMFNAVGAVPVGAWLAKLLGHMKLMPAFHLRELVLHARATVNRFEAKAYFAIAPDYYALASTAPVLPGTAVNPKEVINLTARMKPDGTLDWTPPPGHWIVLRMGYSLEGATNHPAPPADTGLEVDKLSRADVRSYMEHYLDLYHSVTGPFGPNSVTAFTTDSTEVGMQNWTPRMLADFRTLRGYDPTPWLPALTGVVVGSPAQSDKFLWDFRRTINELLARNHYREIQRLAHAQGLVTYGEALEDHRPTFGDDMEMREYTDIPMGAMWMYPPDGRPYPTYVADLRGAASVAHIYGRKWVGAESLDSVDQPWAFAPRELKPVIDEAFLLGVNRVVIHESAEQPLNKPPGFSLGPFGQMFERLDTWAPEAGAWIRYIARCSYLLQQGRYVADIAYFYGQEAPITGVFGNRRIDVPPGYGFDFVNSDILRNQLSVADHRLVTRSGMRYRLLYLGGSSRWMTFNVLRRIDTLVRKGAIVVGRRPIGSPSLRDDRQRFQALARALFGPVADTAARHVGKGMVFPAGSLPLALAALGLQPDFEYDASASRADLRAIHRKLPDGDLYFVSNRKDRAARVTASFRVAGRVPQLWNPVTGTTTPVSYRRVNDRTRIPLQLAPYESVFVMFGSHTLRSFRVVTKRRRHTLLYMRGPWKITFQRGRGAPAEIHMRHLHSWTKSTIPGVKYFSGTATYAKTFRLRPRQDTGKVALALGRVRDLARVTVNGHAVGVIWTPPFTVNITQYVHPGINHLSVAVTNLWVNRLIGDQQPGVRHKFTFTAVPTYEADAPLRPSGLLGPVRLERMSTADDGR